MANININRDVTDQFYRYKMPRLLAKVEGKGNGIKTVIVNMLEIAKALHRPPTYPTKFFGCELGAQTQFDVKNDRFIVNGSHDSAKLQDLLHNFIKRYVLCEECDNPETNLVVKKNMILARCIACGHQMDIDMRHKLTTFILKNPPNNEDPCTTIGTTPSKKDKKTKKAKGVNGDASPEPASEFSKAPLPNQHHDLEDDDVDWGEDVSDAAVAERMEALTGAAKSMTVTDDLEKSPQERINIFYEYLKAKKSADQLTGSDNEKAIIGEAERLDIKEKAPLVMVEVLLDSNILAQLKTYRNLFCRFTSEDAKGQKYMMGGLEQLIGVVHTASLMPKTPHVLKLCYELDIIDEEVIIDWDSKISKKYVSKEVSKEIHEKASPFIKWLKEAEEESSEEEEEEEDGVEVAFSTSGKVGTEVIKPSVSNGNGQTANGQDDEDDFDIDEI
ncbi:hypothetical protein CAPTEDRAFT_21718 [Capitella teleta]|uniref:Eukaryotic translation initiation factor 5 n=1 Tax=Capitella teleta TaxID=283909 RepID=R7TTR5_CAPTE|nr:hypothetical protein CAPTEDRAFT_21718 [Capitella teleta]|eukprot:ELT94836.1 hypothetical protein CAPTEDRAFT_21718 [Capitella teleta]